jgi:hypothetical protein
LQVTDGVYALRVAVASAASDLPDRLIVVDRETRREIASWPLVERPARLAVYKDIAILAGARRSALYALRISDGRLAQIGIARAGDSPLIGSEGVVYQDDLDLANDRAASTLRTLNLLPLAAVRRELARPFSTVRMYMSYTRPAPTDVRPVRSRRPAHRGAEPPRRFTSPPITAMAMDGPRVALAIHDPRGRCDYVLFWNVPWHYVTRLTRYSGSTCLAVHAPGGITDVAIAGSRALWTTTYGHETRILAASITGCVEWVVARPAGGSAAVAGLSGDGITLAYAVRGLGGIERQRATVGIVPKLWRGEVIERSGSQISGISVNDRRVATLESDGVVQIVREGRGPVRTLHVGAARALSLRPSTVAILKTDRTLDVYSTSTGARIHSWRVPPHVTSLDDQYGIAVLTAPHDVFALNLKTGQTVRLLHTTAHPFAQIEAPGAAVAFNTSGHGVLRFFPMSRLEARLAS